MPPNARDICECALHIAYKANIIGFLKLKAATIILDGMTDEELNGAYDNFLADVALARTETVG